MSNERDAASGDGREPVDPSAAEAAGSSPAAGAASESSAGDDKPRTAPTGDGPDQPDAAEPDSGDSADSAEKAQIVATEPTAGPVAAGSARAAARRSAAQALRTDGPDATEAPRKTGTTEGRKTEGKGTATPSRGSNVATRPNIFQRLGLFLREVVAELRKVIWPSRNQMVTYTIVVIVFVSFMVALVAGLDLLFARGVLAVFG